MTGSSLCLLATSPASSPCSTGNLGGNPKSSISLLSLSAQALMGIPVQWRPKGKRHCLPIIRWNPTANSALEMVKVWPRWRRPFI